MDQKLRFIKLFLFPYNLFQINQKRIDGDEAHGTLKRRAGGTPERVDGLRRSVRSQRFRRVRAAPGFTQHIRPRAKHLVKQYEHGLIR